MSLSYYFYSRRDSKKEPISKCVALSRYKAALQFAQRKQLDLKAFLRLYSVSR